jgi:hypothetical protein
MDDNISILSLLTKLIDSEEQIKVLQLISEDYHSEKLLEKLLGIGEE